MYWEDLTWPELDRTSRTTPVVLNLASIEQHGPHLPLSTDSAIGGFFMQKLDEALGSSVLVLPQVKVCCSAHHMDFPGTLTVRHETLLAYVCDMLESMVAHGFRNMVPLQSSQQVANGRGRFRIRRRPGTTRPHSWLGPACLVRLPRVPALF